MRPREANVSSTSPGRYACRPVGGSVALSLLRMFGLCLSAAVLLSLCPDDTCGATADNYPKLGSSLTPRSAADVVEYLDKVFADLPSRLELIDKLLVIKCPTYEPPTVRNDVIVRMYGMSTAFSLHNTLCDGSDGAAVARTHICTATLDFRWVRFAVEGGSTEGEVMLALMQTPAVFNVGPHSVTCDIAWKDLVRISRVTMYKGNVYDSLLKRIERCAKTRLEFVHQRLKEMLSHM